MLDDPGLIAEFVIEAKEHLANVEDHLLQMEQDAADIDADVVNQVFRAVHSIKGAAGFLGLVKLQALSHSMENVLNLIRERSLTPTAGIVELMLRSVDLLGQMLDDVANSDETDVVEYVRQFDAIAEHGWLPGERAPETTESDATHESTAETNKGKPQEPSASRELDDVLPPLGMQAEEDDGMDAEETVKQPGEEVGEQQATAAPTPAPSKADKDPAKKQKKESSPEASIRVQVEVLDQLMNLAGELVLGRNQLVQAVGSRDYASMESVTTRLDQVTSELQDSIMQTRMQPIGSVFNRFMRVVRDVSNQLGKKCHLELEGQEVEVDKTISEAIGDPLTHLVRNSIDHGIESPNQRLTAGKPEVGRLNLRAYHQSGKVRIEISDDGKGIDPDSLRDKAVSKGLISVDAATQMSDAEAVRLIFHPGFSMAEKITEVSGRGVGMDVVRSNIEKLGGSVDIKTQKGEGTTILLTLPLTLAIIPSMVVGCGEQRFAIPQVNTAELVRIRANECATRIERVKGAEMLRLRGALLPLVRLSDTLDIPSAAELEAKNNTKEDQEARKLDITKEAFNVVVVEAGSLRYGLIVDAMYDSEEIVVKPLGRHVKTCPCLSGATILGDGRVALILDIGGIATQSKLQNRQDEAASADDVAVDADQELQTVLLFANHVEERFAVPMHVVARIERISAADINDVGGEALLHYRGGSLPLLSLEDHISARPREPQERLFVIVFEAMGHEVGLVASSLIDIRNVGVDFDAMVSTEPGVAGTQVIDGVPTRAIDLMALAKTARPDWFRNSEASFKEPDQEAIINPKANQRSEATPTILLAEDSAFFRRQLMSLLNNEGYRIIECEDGQVAWHTLQGGQFDISLILTDVEMPNMDGLELTRRVKADDNLQHLPVIALTSLAGQADEQRGFDAGVDEYQVKLDRENLIESVRRAIPSEIQQELQLV